MGQRTLRSDWADAPADLSIRWAYMPLCWFCHGAAQMGFENFLRAGKDSERRKGIVIKSSVVPRQPSELRAEMR